MNDTIPEDDPHYPWHGEKPEDETDEPRGELLPCPFCRGEAEYHPLHTGAGFVMCSKCYACSGDCKNEADATAAWETRAERDRIVAIIERRKAEALEASRVHEDDGDDEKRFQSRYLAQSLESLLKEAKGA
jgi:hypothetical protein